MCVGDGGPRNAQETQTVRRRRNERGKRGKSRGCWLSRLSCVGVRRGVPHFTLLRVSFSVRPNECFYKQLFFFLFLARFYAAMESHAQACKLNCFRLTRLKLQTHVCPAVVRTSLFRTFVTWQTLLRLSFCGSYLLFFLKWFVFARDSLFQKKRKKSKLT